MSKELEAFKDLTGEYIIEDSIGGYETIEQRYPELCAVIIEALTPPTADEVCKALSGWFDEKFYYDVNQKEFYTKALNGQHSVVKLKKNEIHFGGWYTMPPHLITLIGRFYEGLEESK